MGRADEGLEGSLIKAAFVASLFLYSLGPGVVEANLEAALTIAFQLLRSFVGFIFRAVEEGLAVVLSEKVQNAGLGFLVCVLSD